MEITNVKNAKQGPRLPVGETINATTAKLEILQNPIIPDHWRKLATSSIVKSFTTSTHPNPSSQAPPPLSGVTTFATTLPTFQLGSISPIGQPPASAPPDRASVESAFSPSAATGAPPTSIDPMTQMLSVVMPDGSRQMTILLALMKETSTTIKTAVDLDWGKFVDEMKAISGYDPKKHKIYGYSAPGQRQNVTTFGTFLALFSFMVGGSAPWEVHVRHLHATRRVEDIPTRPWTSSEFKPSSNTPEKHPRAHDDTSARLKRIKRDPDDLIDLVSSDTSSDSAEPLRRRVETRREGEQPAQEEKQAAQVQLAHRRGSAPEFLKAKTLLPSQTISAGLAPAPRGLNTSDTWYPLEFNWGTEVERITCEGESGENRDLDGTGLEVASTEHQELLDDTYLIFRIPRPTADSDNNDACTPDIALPGMARKLYLHQLKDVAFLAQQTQTRGGCVAEPPGLGKSAILQLFCVVKCHSIRQMREITQDRRAGRDDRHCIVPLDQQTGDEECPSDQAHPEAGPIVCGCLKRNPTSRWDFERGATLLFTPPALIADCAAEWERNVDPKFPGNPCMLIAHNSAKGEQKYTKSNGFDAISMHSRAVPRVDAERHVILTTPQSYDGQILQQHPHKFGPQGKKSWDGIIWGCIIRDESHLETKQTNTQFFNLRHVNFGLKKHFKPWVIWATGTPIYNGIETQRPWVLKLKDDMAEDYDWSNDTVLREISSQWFDDNKSLYKDIMKADYGSEEYNDKSNQMGRSAGPLLTKLMIRHHRNSRISGKLLVKLPPHVCRDINCPIIDSQKKVIEISERSLRKTLWEKHKIRVHKWQNEGSNPLKSPIGFSLSEILAESKNQRIMINVPGLYPLHFQDQVNLTWKEIDKKGWDEEPRESAYFKNMDALYKSSSKLQQLWKMQNDIRPLRHGIDKEQEGLVIFSEDPVMVFIIQCMYLWKGRRIAVITQAANSRDRTALIQNFQNEVDPNTGVRWPRSERYYTLVGTYKLIGFGLTLTRACREIFTEPATQQVLVEQARYRINRIGQTATRTDSYQLVTAESPLEQLSLNRHKAEQDSARCAYFYMVGSENVS